MRPTTLTRANRASHHHQPTSHRSKASLPFSLRSLTHGRALTDEPSLFWQPSRGASPWLANPTLPPSAASATWRGRDLKAAFTRAAPLVATDCRRFRLAAIAGGGALAGTAARNDDANEEEDEQEGDTDDIDGWMDGWMDGLVDGWFDCLIMIGSCHDDLDDAVLPLTPPPPALHRRVEAAGSHLGPRASVLMRATSNALLSMMPESDDDDTPLTSPSKMRLAASGGEGAPAAEVEAAGPGVAPGLDADAQKVRAMCWK